MTSADGHPRRTGFLSRGFRPFFLGSSVLAALAVPLWALSFAGGLDLLQDVFSRNWHAHEMIFGYAGGVIGGFALTAVPNWTGRLPVSGKPLAGLFVMWLAGRLAFVAMPLVGSIATALLDCSYFVFLAGYLLREIIAAGNLRNLPIAGMVSALALANLVWHVSQNAILGRGCRRAMRPCRGGTADHPGRRARDAQFHPQLAQEDRRQSRYAGNFPLLDKAAMAAQRCQAWQCGLRCTGNHGGRRAHDDCRDCCGGPVVEVARPSDIP